MTPDSDGFNRFGSGIVPIVPRADLSLAQADRDHETVDDMAAAMADLFVQQGAATWDDLRGKGFTSDEINQFGEAAKAKARLAVRGAER